jgi:hypothetical protein
MIQFTISPSSYPSPPHPDPPHQHHLSVALSHSLQLILLLNSIAITAPLRRINQLLSQALSNALDVPESRFTSTDCEEGDGLIDTTERRHIDGLTTDSSGAANTGAIFSGTAVDDGIDGDLERVLVGHDVDLESEELARKL